MTRLQKEERSAPFDSPLIVEEAEHAADSLTPRLQAKSYCEAMVKLAWLRMCLVAGQGISVTDKSFHRVVLVYFALGSGAC